MSIDDKIADTKKEIESVRARLKLKPDNLSLTLKLVELKHILRVLELEK
jgi:hypothetical protein